MDDDVHVGVQVTPAVPGFSAVAFLAVIEVIDPDGDKLYEVIGSDGISDARRARLLNALAGDS